ncbi:hypothetical protein L7F22_046706 [Adiantum nelumboides]|nr:hypothetical protein [Adiantum nelumboides]
MSATENEELLPSSVYAINSREPEEDVDGVASLFGPSQAMSYSSYFTDNTADQRSPPPLLPSRAPAGNLMVRGLMSNSCMGARLPTPMVGEDGDSACENPTVSATANTQTPPQQSSMAAGGGRSNATTDGQSDGIKRKRRERVNVNSMKDMAESTQKLASSLDVCKDRKNTREESRGRRMVELEEMRHQVARDTTQAMCSSF